MRYFVSTNQQECEITIAKGSVSIAGTERNVNLHSVRTPQEFSLLLDNHSFDVFVYKTDKGYRVDVNGKKYEVALEDEKERLIRSLTRADIVDTGRTEVKAPMPGLIVKIYPDKGQVVQKGDALYVIEAMKMENEIKAVAAGTVNELLVNEGDSVERDSVLMIIE